MLQEFKVTFCSDVHDWEINCVGYFYGNYATVMESANAALCRDLNINPTDYKAVGKLFKSITGVKIQKVQA